MPTEQKNQWTKGIDWRFLCNTPAGSWGIMPVEGYRFYHSIRTPMAAEQIVVDLGREALIRTPTKTGWSRPAMVSFDDIDRQSIASVSTNKIASIR